VLEDQEAAKSTLHTFLNINDQMDAAIVAVQVRSSPEEYKAFKLGVGYVMAEIFEKIIVPICDRHPELKPPAMK
jgi:hypothetical protein